MFQEALEECIKNLGDAPRRISLWDRITYWRIARPDWLYASPDDSLETLFLNLDKIRKDGVVVWGHLVQANYLMFSPGVHCCPGEVVYSFDSAAMKNPMALSVIASNISALKHTKPTEPGLAAIAHHLTNEMTRVFGMNVPPSLSPRIECRLSTVYFIRKHLPSPNRCLQQSLMPIVVNPKPPHVALVLPSRYWPKQLIDWWQSDEEDENDEGLD